jgi:hypothetical protein
MALDTFTEKQIRDAILNIISPEKISKGKHWKGYIYLDKKLITKIKIPNAHNRLFRANKARFLARDLKISDDQYNDLASCPLTGPAYYEILKKLEG